MATQRLLNEKDWMLPGVCNDMAEPNKIKPVSVPGGTSVVISHAGDYEYLIELMAPEIPPWSLLVMKAPL